MAETEIIIEPGQQDIIFRHVFDAPPEIVFRALTEPELVKNWYGPRIYETIVDELDARAGGRWRFINRNAEGQEFGFHGVFHEVTPERIIQTTEFEGMPGHVGLETATLTKQNAKTLFEATALFPSVEDRDINVANGMEGGARESYQRLEEVIAGLAARV